MHSCGVINVLAIFRPFSRGRQGRFPIATRPRGGQNCVEFGLGTYFIIAALNLKLWYRSDMLFRYEIVAAQRRVESSDQAKFRTF